MAEILETFPADVRGMPHYPWGEWLDGQVWKLTHGVDFQCVHASIRAAIYQAANRKGVKVQTTITEDGSVILRAYPR